MANEVNIRVTATDDTSATKEKIKAGLATTGVEAGQQFSTKFKESTEKQAPAKVPVEAKNPIDEAWRAQLQASIKGIASDAIKIPMSPDTAKYREELALAVGELQSAVTQKIPVDMDGADQFKLHVEELAREVAAEVKAKIPVEVQEPDEQKTEEAGQKAGDSFSRGLTARQALITTAIVAGIVAGGPLIDAAGLGMGAAFMAAMGAEIQKGNPAIQAGWAKLKADATQSAQQASAGMVAPLAQAMTQIDGLIKAETPLIAKMFKDAAADVPILTQAVSNFVSGALPGMESGLANSQQIMTATAAVAGDLGTAVGRIGASFGAAAPEAATGLHALGSIIDELGQSISEVVTFATKLASGTLPVLASGLNGVLGAATGLLHVLEPIAPELGAITAYGVEAWGSFKLADVATSSVNSLSQGLSKAAASFESYGSKLVNSGAASTTAGSAMALAATGAANFTGKAASLAETVAGPLGIALGLGSFALELFGQNSDQAAQKAQEQADVTKNLAQAFEQSGGAIDANVRSTLTQALAQDSNVASLQKYGVSLATVQQLVLQGNGAIDKQVQSLQSQKNALLAAGSSYTTVYGQMGQSSQQLTATARAQVGALDGQIQAWQALANTMPDAIKQQKAFADAVNASATSMGIHVGSLSTAQQATEAYDSTLNSAVQLYLQNTSAIKTYVDAVVGAAGANLTAQQTFQQLDAAVTTAQQGVMQAAAGVTSAQHSLVDASDAVDSARHSEQQAVQGVTDAQYNYQQSLLAEKQAQQNLMAARQAAADQLASLQRQVTDQGDSVDAAKLRLLQAQQAVAAAGLTGQTLAGLGDPTASNQNAYQLLLELSQAQHALNDAQAQAADLGKQNAAAQAAGIDGAQGVIQAQEALSQAQHGVQQASIGVQNAQYAEKQASQAVRDALWSQQAAQVALTQAQMNGLDAQKKLTQAKDDDSRTLDINTVAGNRNWQMIEDLYDKNLLATGSVSDATTMTENETTQLGFNKDAVKGVIDTLGGLNGHSFDFSVVGTPTLDLNPLKGIVRDPTLGLFTNAAGDSGGIASAGRLAAGGPISGPGGPTDDVIHAMLSAGEYVQPADTVNYYGVEYMDALRKKKLPRYASGGSVGDTPLGLNMGAAVAWGMYETADRTANALGAKPPLPTAMPAPGNFSAGAYGSLGAGAGGGNSTPATGGTPQAAQQYAASRLAAYGWGPNQMPPLISLWNQESGWNPYAVNPSSGAYGIPQSLGHGHPYNLGDYVAQINWGLSYIQGRYGSPSAAWAHERAYNWYGAGGPYGGGIGGMNEYGPELVRLPNGSTVVPASSAGNEVAKLAGADAPTGFTFNFAGNVDTAFARLFMNLLRSGQIRIDPAYVGK